MSTFDVEWKYGNPKCNWNEIKFTIKSDHSGMYYIRFHDVFVYIVLDGMDIFVSIYNVPTIGIIEIDR